MSLPAFTQLAGGTELEISAIATEAMSPGMIYSWGSRFVYIDGNNSFAIGALFNGKDLLNLRSRRVASAFTALSIAVGADIYVETATGLPKTAGGAGIIGPVGTVTRAKAAGVEHVEFRLNGQEAGPWIPDGAINAATDGGTMQVTQYLTKWTTTAPASGTLPDGTRYGQLKKVLLVVDGGTGTLTPTNFVDGTSIAFADAGDFVEFMWTAAGWRAIETGNTVDGVSAPVIT